MFAAILPVLKIAGAALAAVSIVKGLKEGNLLKAVAGGVGAYFAFSGLGASTAIGKIMEGGAGAVGSVAPEAAISGAADLSAVTAAGKMGADTAMSEAMTQGFGAQAGTEMATEGLTSAAAAEGLTGKAAEYGFGAAAEGAGAGADTALGASDLAADQGLDLATQEAATVAPTEEGGLLSQFEKFQTPSATAAPVEEGGLKGFLSQAAGFAKENPELLKMGGQMISGWAKEQARQKEIDRLMREQARARNRRGASVGTESVSLNFSK